MQLPEYFVGFEEVILKELLAKNINVAPGEHQAFTRKHDFSLRFFDAGGVATLYIVRSVVENDLHAPIRNKLIKTSLKSST